MRDIEDRVGVFLGGVIIGVLLVRCLNGREVLSTIPVLGVPILSVLLLIYLFRLLGVMYHILLEETAAGTEGDWDIAGESDFGKSVDDVDIFYVVEDIAEALVVHIRQAPGAEFMVVNTGNDIGGLGGGAEVNGHFGVLAQLDDWIYGCIEEVEFAGDGFAVGDGG